MAVLEHFAYHAFVVDESLDVATIALANKFRELIADKVYESGELHKRRPYDSSLCVDSRRRADGALARYLRGVHQDLGDD